MYTSQKNSICAICILVLVRVSNECALPYWWIEAYSISNKSQLLIADPNRSYHFRESFQVFDQNNFVHIKEYSWWEHNRFSSVDNGIANPRAAGAASDAQNVKTITGIVDGSMKGVVNNPKTGVTSFKKNTADTEKSRLKPKSTTSTEKSTTSSEKSTTSTSTTTSTTTTSTPDGPEVLSSTTARSVERNPEVERNENEDSVPVHLEELQDGGNDLLKVEESGFGNPSLFPPWFGFGRNETKPCKTSEADIQSLRSMIENMFSVPRDHLHHLENKEKARKDILKKFQNLGLQVWTQNFTIASHSSSLDEEKSGVNLIGVIPGSNRGQLNDGIVLVGAHYDTVANSNGVDDNGSGLAVMLEVAKALSLARCRLNNTLMFVAFDLEEEGAMGSNHFVETYLIPEELKRARAHFQGAFILDGVLNYNSAPNTQELPRDFVESLPGLQSFVNYTGNRGDFLAMISRNEMDNHLTTKLMESWQKLGDQNYKLFNLAVDMGNDIPAPSVLENHLNFLSSDHSAFWYHNSSSFFPETLNAVLLTDTGPFRGQMQKCYHSECDDLSNMSPEKLQFAKKTADALTATLVEMTRATANGYWLKAEMWYPTFLLVTISFYTKWIQ